MNCTVQKSLPVSKRSISPRPQTVGKEVKNFHETSNHCKDSYKSCTCKMEDQQESSPSVVERLYQSTTPAECSLDFAEDIASTSPPPSLKWAQSLLCLLEDIQGVNLFKQFLQQEGQDIRSLNFWFACQGVKRADPSDKEGLRKLIRLIFEKKVTKISAINQETKDEIKQKLSSNVGVDDAIFDAAQKEVEAYMMKTTYPNFLKSDLYMQHVPNIRDYSVYNRSKQKRQQKATKHNAPVNKDGLSHNTFIPRTQRLPESMNQYQTPEEFHSVLVKKLNKVLEEQKVKEKITEKLKILNEGNEYPKPEMNPVPNQRPFHRPSPAPVFDGLYYGSIEDNVQDILDQHVSRVFNDSGQHSPVCSSPGCISPSITRPCNDIDRSRIPSRGLTSYEPTLEDLKNEALQKINHNTQFTVPYAFRHRRDFDTYSKDSCTTYDYYSDDNSYRSQCYSTGNEDPVDYSQNRRSREQYKRNYGKKFSSMTDSSSSCVDSGISLACESIAPSTTKVTHWLETSRSSSDQEKELVWKTSSTSPILSRPSSNRKAYYGTTPWPATTQEMCLSAYPPDITFNLLEARRRLEDESRAKMKLKCALVNRNYHEAGKIKFSKACDLIEDGFSHRKQSRKTCPGATEVGNVNVNYNEVTVIGYSYGRHSVPYLSKLPGKKIFLKQFKSLLSKKGNFRYFFKKASDDFGTGVVFEEITEDLDELPLWEGKVFCVIESMDDN